MFQKSTLQDVKVEVEGRKYSPADVVQGLKSPDVATKTLAARAAILMQDRSSLVLVDAGVIPLLAEALGHKDCTDLQLAAATCLARLCVHRSAAVVDGGAIPALVGALRALPADERGAGSAVGEQAAQALGRIAVKGGASRDAVLSAGGLWAMLPHMRPDTPRPLLLQTVDAYDSMCLRYAPRMEVVELSPALPYIADLLLKTDDEIVLYSACSALHNLTRGYPSLSPTPSPSLAHVEAVVSTPELVPRLAQLLLRAECTDKTRPLNVLHILLNGTDSQRQRCLDAGCLAPIIACLSRSDKDDFVDKPRQELAARVVTRLCRAPRQLVDLLAPACLRAYCALLASRFTDIVKLVLDGLTCLLQAAAEDGTVEDVCLQLELVGAVELMQQLQLHKDDEVYVKNRHLIEEYFGVEEPVIPNQNPSAREINTVI